MLLYSILEKKSTIMLDTYHIYDINETEFRLLELKLMVSYVSSADKSSRL